MYPLFSNETLNKNRNSEKEPFLCVENYKY